MLAEEINQVFDKALGLKEGEVIRISCASRSEQDSTRAQLYRVRKTYCARIPSPINISISRLTHTDKAVEHFGGNKYFVVLKRVENQAVEIIAKDGTTTPLHTTITQPQNDLETQRIINLMREDGFSEEEIDEHFAGKPEEETS